MKQCKVYECKRRALGLTQKEVADLAGVSPATIVNFEAGNELSIPVFRTIKGVIDEQFNALERQESYERKILQYAFQLEYSREDEKLKTAALICLAANKLGIALINKEDEEA